MEKLHDRRQADRAGAASACITIAQYKKRGAQAFSASA
jgi:hypothetical protein